MSFRCQVAGIWLEFADSLSKKEFNSLTGTIGSYKDCFISKKLDKNCRFNKRKFKIKTIAGVKPINKKSSLTANDNLLLKEKIDGLVKTGHLIKSTSKWSSPVYLNMNNTSDLFIDYNELNDLILRDDYRITSRKEVLNSIGKSKRFTKLVIKDILHQLSLEESSRCITAFDTEFGCYEFTTLHNSIKNSQKCIQIAMDLALKKIEKTFFTIYLDKLLIFADDFNEHLECLKQIFRCLRESNLKLDSNQCFFMVHEINLSGYLINQHGITINLDKLDRINEFSTIQSKNELNKFLNLSKEYREFVEDFDDIARSLNDLVSSNEKEFYFHWDEFVAFKKLKSSFIDIKPIEFGKF